MKKTMRMITGAALTALLAVALIGASGLSLAASNGTDDGFTARGNPQGVTWESGTVSRGNPQGVTWEGVTWE